MRTEGEGPLAFGKMGTKVPSARVSCPWGRHCGAGEMGTDASWRSMETDQRCCAVCGESRMHGAQRGLRHEVVSVIVVLDLVSGHNPLSHQRYPTKMCRKVTICTAPSDNEPTVIRLASQP